MRGQQRGALRGRHWGDFSLSTARCDPNRPVLKNVAGQVVRRSQDSSGGVVWLAEACAVVVGVVVGVIVWLVRTVSDRMPMHDRVIVVRMQVRDGQQPGEHNGKRSHHRDNAGAQGRRHSLWSMSARARQSQTGGSSHQRNISSSVTGTLPVMRNKAMSTGALVIASVWFTCSAAAAQGMPAEYQGVLDVLARTGDFKDGVLKVNIPRNDIKVTVAGVATPTPFGFGGWIALTKGTGMAVMMGDLVLTQDEVNPVMSAVLAQGLDVTALHNHFFWESPRMFYMHVHGHGSAADLAKRIKPAIDLIGKIASRPDAAPAMTSTVTSGTLDTAKLASIIGTTGEQNGQVYKITIGRPDLKVQEMGAAINARMGLNTWAAFFGSDAAAVVAGDVAMIDTEVTPVLKALRDNGIEVVAIHHHMTATQPTVIFLHYWGQGPAEKLATAVRAAVNQTGPRPTK